MAPRTIRGANGRKFYILNLLMLPTFVIETPGRQASLDLKVKLQQWHLETMFVEGVVGSDLSDEQINGSVDLELFRHRIGYVPPKSLIGCGLSHIKVYQLILQMNLDWALILESDCIPVLDPSCMTSIFSKAEFKDLPCIFQLFSRGERVVKSEVISKIQSREKVEVGIYEYLYPPRQTAAYIVNRHAVLEALKSPKLDGPPDWPSWSTRVKFFAVYPWFFIETNERSTIPSFYRGKLENTLEKLSVLSGIDFVKNGKLYKPVSYYFRLKVKPMFLRALWKVLGKKTLSNSEDAPWVIL